MPKFHVRIQREECIMDGVCWSLCPDVFEANSEDGKSQITKKYRINNRIDDGEVLENLEACVKEASMACPVQIIRVEEFGDND